MKTNFAWFGIGAVEAVDLGVDLHRGDGRGGGGDAVMVDNAHRAVERGLAGLEGANEEIGDRRG